MRALLRATTALLLGTILALNTVSAAAPVTLPDGNVLEKVDFERHIMGLLGRLGCNSGACHGSFQGKGGLSLSLFGYYPEKDYYALTRDLYGRRVHSGQPESSLFLMKPSGLVAHEGGKRFEQHSWQYQVFSSWVADGAAWKPGSSTIARVQVLPEELRFSKPGEAKQLKVQVEFADGARLDMTPFCDFRSNDDFVAEVSAKGEVRARHPGDTALVVSYRGQVVAVRALVPVPETKGVPYPRLAEVNYIDREVSAKLRKLNIAPSEPASDSAFLRRVYVDTIGCLPEPEQVRAFLTDTDPAKRARKIDELLAHPLHAALWATKFSDITGNNVDTMGEPTELNAKWSMWWHDWLRKRLAENMPYDQIVRGMLVATSREGQTLEEWIRRSNQLDAAAERGFENKYQDRATLDLFWRKANPNFTLELLAERAAVAFLGVRLECAQCHKHPFDRWTQVDYRQFANIFSRLQFGVPPADKALFTQENERRRAEYKARGINNARRVPQLREVFVIDKPVRQLPHPETTQPLLPKALGGPEIRSRDDPRLALYEWLRQPDNPYFARSLVNRVWGHYFGIGIVEPVDDFSVSNPPSNATLLDALARDFIEHQFDLRHVERTILLSQTYQRSSAPNATNRHDRNNFSRSYSRRLMAEVVVDVLNSALGVVEDYGGASATDAPPGRRAIEIPTNRVRDADLASILRIFGRSTRASSCDCDRPRQPALPQVLFLMTEPKILSKIANGRLKTLLASKQGDEAIIEELFLASLTRLPTDTEKRWALEHMQKKKDRAVGFVDVTWALINTREFILNH